MTQCIVEECDNEADVEDMTICSHCYFIHYEKHR